MNNRWLSSFITVAQTGSMTAAAKELFISPQALQQQINLLEAEVGAKLLLRSNAGVSLSIAGKEFLNGAKQILALYERTVTRCQLASHAEKVIRIPMMSSIILPELMERVCAQYRKLPAHLRIELITDENFGSRMAGLLNLKYDIIEHFALDGQCPDGIYFEHLSSVRSWCIMTEYHPLSPLPAIRPEDLNGHRLLISTDNTKLLRYLQIRLETTGIDTKIDYIENDRYQIIDGLDKGGIYLANEDIARIFVGYTCAPLDFDTHVQHGFACREEMRNLYKPFFNIAHQIVES